MYHVYHFVPYCRRCDSKKTAYAVPTSNNPERNALQHLRKGEYIFESDRKEYNCACLECGIFWKDEIRVKFLNDEQFVAEKKDREINVNDDQIKNMQSALKNKKEKVQMPKRKLTRMEKWKQKAEKATKNTKIFLGL